MTLRMRPSDLAVHVYSRYQSLTVIIASSSVTECTVQSLIKIYVIAYLFTLYFGGILITQNTPVVTASSVSELQ